MCSTSVVQVSTEGVRETVSSGGANITTVTPEGIIDEDDGDDWSPRPAGLSHQPDDNKVANPTVTSANPTSSSSNSNHAPVTSSNPQSDLDAVNADENADNNHSAASKSMTSASKSSKSISDRIFLLAAGKDGRNSARCASVGTPQVGMNAPHLGMSSAYLEVGMNAPQVGMNAPHLGMNSAISPAMTPAVSMTPAMSMTPATSMMPAVSMTPAASKIHAMTPAMNSQPGSDAAPDCADRNHDFRKKIGSNCEEIANRKLADAQEIANTPGFKFNNVALQESSGMIEVNDERLIDDNLVCHKPFYVVELDNLYAKMLQDLQEHRKLLPERC
jgi:hypothetical protein